MKSLLLGTLLPSMLVLLLASSTVRSAFVDQLAAAPRRRLQQQRGTSSSSPRGGSVGLSAGLFDDIRNFFEDAMGGSSGSYNNGGGVAEQITTRVATIPVESIKPGGLRLFLMFYLMGQQNTPDKNSWIVYERELVEEDDDDDYDDEEELLSSKSPQSQQQHSNILDYYFRDGSGILTIKLGQDEVTVDRTGFPEPSTSYLMQESIIVNGVLDELHQCAFDDAVSEPDRLLLLPERETDAIDKARNALAFG